MRILTQIFDGLEGIEYQSSAERSRRLGVLNELGAALVESRVKSIKEPLMKKMPMKPMKRGPGKGGKKC